MKWVWGLLLLFACTPEYGIESTKDVPDVVVDTATVDTGTPRIQVDPPEPPEAENAKILVEPYDYDFGEVPVNCEEEYTVTISSVGELPLVIENLIYVNTPDFEMSSEYKLPIIIEPGDSIDIVFTYSEDDLIEDTGRLYIYSNALGKGEQMISHVGVGVPTGEQIDVFEQQKVDKTDILFVIDNSCSMVEEQTDLAADAADFIDGLKDAGVDYQISVITTDDENPVGGLITPTTADPAGELADQVQVGTSGSAFEKGQEMAMLALDLGPLSSSRYGREDAALSVVVISDEEDQSPLTELEYYDFFLTIKDEDLFFFHSVTGIMGSSCDTDIGLRYITQSGLTGGVTLDICAPWGNNLITLANATYIIQSEYPLTKEASPGSVEVFIDGILLEEGWYYDRGTNSVILEDKSIITGDEMFQVIYDYLGECGE